MDHLILLADDSEKLRRSVAGEIGAPTIRLADHGPFDA